MGLAVEAINECADASSVAEPPDVLIARRSFGEGMGAVAICVVRPAGPPDALRLFAEVARGEERVLAKRLGASPDDVARRLVDLVPGLATCVSCEHDEARAPPDVSTRLRASQVLEELEDCLIRLMLGGASSDREAALWLGLREGTLRSKMRKRGIRSRRPRRRPDA